MVITSLQSIKIIKGNKMNKIITALLLTFSITTQASQFEQFVISPYTTMGDTSNYAGIIYFEGSFNHMPKDYLCSQRKINPNQMHMVDQEGGMVVRIKDNDTIPIAPLKAKEMGLKAFSKHLDTVALNLSQKCITTNLAPVADTNYEHGKYNRSYSDEAEEVSKCHFQKLMRLYRNRCDTLLKLVKQKQKNVSLIDQALNPRISRYCL